mmetsp:Transcript_16854/g.24403  ORF Transcript_16854/g.24403 Transcript_16854/m.24403 type:complete len:87 (-) Transcript_16854:141-401(-)
MPSDNNATYNAATPPACVSSVSSQLLTTTQREMKALKAAWTSSEPHPIPALTPRPYSHADRNRQQPTCCGATASIIGLAQRFHIIS